MDAVIVAVAQYFFLISVAITAAVWIAQSSSGKWALAVNGMIGGLAGLGLISLAGALYYDPRPFVVEHIHPLFRHIADNGFPSDHAALTMFLAVCVWLFSRRWGLVLAINALLVGTARVLAHVHSPLDILAGYLIGAIAAALARRVTPAILSRIPLRTQQDPASSRPDHAN